MPLRSAFRMMPHDLPPWYIVYQQTLRWLAASCFENLRPHGSKMGGTPSGETRIASFKTCLCFLTSSALYGCKDRSEMRQCDHLEHFVSLSLFIYTFIVPKVLVQIAGTRREGPGNVVGRDSSGALFVEQAHFTTACKMVTGADHSTVKLDIPSRLL